jgi:hypothetical protein
MRGKANLLELVADVHPCSPSVRAPGAVLAHRIATLHPDVRYRPVLLVYIHAGHVNRHLPDLVPDTKSVKQPVPLGRSGPSVLAGDLELTITVPERPVRVRFDRHAVEGVRHTDHRVGGKMQRAGVLRRPHREYEGICGTYQVVGRKVPVLALEIEGASVVEPDLHVLGGHIPSA